MHVHVPFLLACGLIAAVSIPPILRWVGPNPIYGFRTPRTHSSPEIWYPANAFAGRVLLIAAGVSAASLSFTPRHFLSHAWVPLFLFVAPLAVAVVVCFLSLHRFKK
jgi:uncharacterized membrane protein